jgi:DNA-binding response OmpR family regulator
LAAKNAAWHPASSQPEASGIVPDRTRALVSAGEDRIVQKPFRGDELGRKLQALLVGGEGQPNVVAFRQPASHSDAASLNEWRL